MLAAPRTKTIREAEEVLLIDVVEDGDHCVLDDLVLQCGDPERTLPSVAFLDVNPSRWKRPIRTAMHPAVQIGKPTLQSGFILLPRHPIYAGSSLAFQRTEAAPQQIDGDMVEQSGELHLLVFPCCFPHTRQPL